MINCFRGNEQAFVGNGLATLDTDIINPVIVEELNGMFEFTFSYPIQGQGAMALAVGEFVSAPCPERDDPQVFRISECKRTIDGLLEITARHIFFDLAGEVIDDINLVGETAQGALDKILKKTTSKSSFTARSSMHEQQTANARIVRASISNALLDTGMKNSFISRWGGEFRFDNSVIYHMPRRGANNEAQITDGVNLIAFESTFSNANVVNRILPVGFDGLTLPEVFIEDFSFRWSPTANTKVVKFPEVKAIKPGDENPDEDALPLKDAIELLRQKAGSYFVDNMSAWPTESVKVDFVTLSSTNQGLGKGRKDPGDLALGDIVRIRNRIFNYESTARAIAYSWDPLRQTFIDVTLGSYAPRFSQIASKIDKIDDISEQSQTAANKSVIALKAANGKNRNFYGPDQPANPVVGDTWFKENGEKTEVWIYREADGVKQWHLLSGDLANIAVEAELQTARAEVSDAVAKASAATKAAESASAALDAAQGKIDEAKAVATKAQEDALLVKNAADQNAVAINALKPQIEDAITKATQAETAAANANNAGQAALDAASQAATDASSATAKAFEAYAKAMNTNDDLAAFKVQVANQDKTTSASITALENNINLRVEKNKIINQINISDETILIAGNRIHITGKTTIDDAVIGSAMIKDAAITNAKIASLDAGKINTGYLAAARIAAKSITSDKLVIANGFITNAMIADATITNAKIGNLDAGKITTGYLAAARIAAKSITSDKLVIANGFIVAAMIADATITNAKIANLDAGKINTGYLAAARIKTGAITSDKLTIADGYIQTAMIHDAAITNAKIANLDAAKITTGFLNSARIASQSITADHLKVGAIETRLAGWNKAIRITPEVISWYDGRFLQGQLSSQGMRFYFGNNFIGGMGQTYKRNNPNIRGIAMDLSPVGRFVTWSYAVANNEYSAAILSLDPKGLFYDSPGIHLGGNLVTHGASFITESNLAIVHGEYEFDNIKFPSWTSSSRKSGVSFGENDLYLVTGNSYYNATKLFTLVLNLTDTVNSLLAYFNKGWVQKITSKPNGGITWDSYSGTGLSTLSRDVG